MTQPDRDSRSIPCGGGTNTTPFVGPRWRVIARSFLVSPRVELGEANLDRRRLARRMREARVHVVNVERTLNLFEHHYVRVARVVQILELLEVVDQVVNDRLHIAGRVE